MKSYRDGAMREVRRELARRNEAAGFLVEGNVKRRTPVDTGRLRASYTHDADEDGVVIGTNTQYAPFVELGTRYQNPQPHLVPGLVASIPELRRIYGGEVS